MQLSDAGRAFLMLREGGAMLHTYQDSAGYLTVGVGHLVTPKEKASGVFAKGLTMQQALDLFHHDTAWAENDVSQRVTVPLTQHQFDALVSFVFNVGDGNFAKSSLLRLLNQGYYTAAGNQLPRWDHAGGKQVRGLTARRALELQLWESDWV
jgi:lysozyme